MFLRHLCISVLLFVSLSVHLSSALLQTNPNEDEIITSNENIAKPTSFTTLSTNPKKYSQGLKKLPSKVSFKRNEKLFKENVLFSRRIIILLIPNAGVTGANGYGALNPYNRMGAGNLNGLAGGTFPGAGGINGGVPGGIFPGTGGINGGVPGGFAGGGGGVNPGYYNPPSYTPNANSRYRKPTTGR